MSTRLPFRLLADTEWLREPPPASRRRSMEATDDARRREAVRLMATYALNSAPLLHIARGAYDRRSAPDTIVAVVFAAFGLEAFVNEALERSRFSATAPELAKRLVLVADAAGLYSASARVRHKLQVLSEVLTGQKLNTQAAPYVDAHLLIDARNFLVHQWPEKLQDDAGERVRQQLVDRLAARGFL